MRPVVILSLAASLAGCAEAQKPQHAPLIAFVAPSVSGNEEDLWVVSSEGGRPRRLVSDVWGIFGSSWSPDGRRLAVTVDIGDNGGDIFVVNSDGTGLKRLTYGGHAENVSWSPDGNSLAFEWTVSRIDGPTWIDIANSDGTHVRKVAAPDGDVHWSPSGRQLVVSGGIAHTYVVDVRTGRVDQRFPPHTLDDSWSRDGQRVAFVAGNRHRLDLYVSRVNSLLARRFVYQGISVYEPRWSPDGTLIAFSGTYIRRCATGRCEAIFVVRPDGTGLRRITLYQGTNEEPSWSNDGHSIADVGGPTDGPLAIYVMNPDGSSRRRIVMSPQPDNLVLLAWQPPA
jgi:Tol biopolymer transport system component